MMHDGSQAAISTLCNAIENGTLSYDETERRLIQLIEQERAKGEASANELLIAQCASLLHDLQSHREASHEARKASNLAEIQRTCVAWQRRTRRAGRIAAMAAAIALLFTGLHSIRIGWISSSSSTNEQQYVVQAHEVSIDVLQAAVADHKESSQFQTASQDELISFLGFDPNIPSIIDDKWTSTVSVVTIVPEWISISTMYQAENNQHMVFTVYMYLDPTQAFLSFEQDAEGEEKTILNRSVYVTPNIARTVAIWMQNNVVYNISAPVDEAELLTYIQSMIGGTSS